MNKSMNEWYRKKGMDGLLIILLGQIQSYRVVENCLGLHNY